MGLIDTNVGNKRTDSNIKYLYSGIGYLPRMKGYSYATLPTYSQFWNSK